MGNKVNASRTPAKRLILLRAGLALALISLVVVLPARKVGATPTLAFVTITDDVNGDFICYQKLTTPGPVCYLFHHNSTNFTLTGRGFESFPSGVITLTDKEPDRSVSAGFLPGQETGSAAIYYLTIAGGAYKVFTIRQTKPTPDPIGCGVIPRVDADSNECGVP